MSYVDVLFKMKTLNKLVVKKLVNTEKCSEMPTTTPTQMKILVYMLKHKDEEVYQKDLEKVLALSRATVSNVLKTMEKNGLIERATSKKDSRVKQIIMKDKTKTIFDKNCEKAKEISTIAFNNISEDEIKELDRVLDKIIGNLEKKGEKNINV